MCDQGFSSRSSYSAQFFSSLLLGLVQLSQRMYLFSCNHRNTTLIQLSSEMSCNPTRSFYRCWTWTSAVTIIPQGLYRFSPPCPSGEARVVACQSIMRERERERGSARERERGRQHIVRNQYWRDSHSYSLYSTDPLWHLTRHAAASAAHPSSTASCWNWIDVDDTCLIFNKSIGFISGKSNHISKSRKPLKNST